ncbi:MAG: LPS export ABC transporter ATP-binding protein [Planctomycetes bacterium]|nr:LPS export ABC transporter ATP-binding protein [Planctomycetota bacterium]
MALLEARNLVKIYGQKCVVDDVTIQVDSREVVGLLGPNGAGKTTTFSMIIGRIPPSQGGVFFDGHDISGEPMYRRARLGMAYLAQEPSIFDGLTVEENLLAILEFHEPSRKRRMERLEELLGKLDLTEHRKLRSSRLSGGLRRRLEITRALITNPKLIMLDEPFAGVDPLVVEDIQNIIRKLRDEGLGLLITDHNVPATLRITDRAYIVQQGTTLVAGTAREIADSELAREKYLGHNFRLN